MNLALNINEAEAEVEGQRVLLMDAGAFTGVYHPLPVDEAVKVEMREEVAKRAQYYLELADDAELTNGEDIPLAEIKESIFGCMVKVAMPSQVSDAVGVALQ